ncbi:Arc family DNA-binding protein [Proteus mirabilis]|uniref:Arc family DNA-binding protein n=1 Tax=Providencia stuartii TaxID=588 RepID=UPI002AAEEC1F|nr:Arc family DNA-binding protein [Proteus mirabilis]
MSERKYKHPQVNLRMPNELKDKIATLAEMNGRSANQEMVAAIEAWVNKHDNIEDLSLVSLAERLSILEREVADLTKQKLGG